jgi:hypothetical protein
LQTGALLACFSEKAKKAGPTPNGTWIDPGVWSLAARLT